MLLRHEEGIEIPEAVLDVVVGGHFGEAHLEENLSELGAHFEERMQVA